MRTAIGALTALALLSAACGGLGGSDDDTLSVWGFGLPDEIASTRVEVFRKAHPDVPLTINEGAFDEQVFLSSVAAGNPPDVIYLPRGRIGTYATRGAIVPLDTCVRARGLDMSVYRKAALAEVTVKNRRYGVPDFYTVIVTLLNERAVKGRLDVSDWAALAREAKELTRTKGGRIERIGFDPKLPEFLPLWAKANGADLLSPDGTRARLNDPRVVEALAFTAGLIREQGGWADVKAFRDTFDLFGAENPITRDQLGAMPTEQFLITAMASTSPDAPLLVEPFRDRRGEPLTYATGSAWAIPKGARHPEQACAWVTTMSTAPTWVAAARARAAKRAKEGKPYTGTYTGNIAADKVIFGELVKPSGHAQYDEAVKVALAVQDHAFSTPPSPAGAEVTKAWQDAVNRVLYGTQDAKASLDRAQEEAQRALDLAVATGSRETGG